MMIQRLLPVAALLALPVLGLNAQCASMHLEDKDLYDLLRKSPSLSTMKAASRMELVNDRYEPCKRRKDARYIRTITPDKHGYTVHVRTRHGFTLMTGHFADAAALVPHGDFRYFDDAGILRAQGRYVDGRKYGIWQRYDDRGQRLSDKEYDGLDWEDKQLKLGLTSQCCYLEEMATRTPEGP